MNYKVTITKKALLYVAKKKRSRKRRQKKIPKQLGQTINECSTLQQLLELLFRTDIVKDEALLDAFDRRIEELDPTFQYKF